MTEAMADRRDIVDISALKPGKSPEDARDPGPPRQPRRWLSIWFNCCSVYARIYRDPGAPFYKGQCPRCGARVRARVGPDGTTRRMFETT